MTVKMKIVIKSTTRKCGKVSEDKGKKNTRVNEMGKNCIFRYVKQDNNFKKIVTRASSVAASYLIFRKRIISYMPFNLCSRNCYDSDCKNYIFSMKLLNFEIADGARGESQLKYQAKR